MTNTLQYTIHSLTLDTLCAEFYVSDTKVYFRGVNNYNSMETLTFTNFPIVNEGKVHYGNLELDFNELANAVYGEMGREMARQVWHTLRRRGFEISPKAITFGPEVLT